MIKLATLILIAFGLFATLFIGGGTSAVKNSNLPADKNEVLSIIEQIEKNAIIYYMNTESFDDMFITTPYQLGYLDSDGWTDKLKDSTDSKYSPAAPPAPNNDAATDYYVYENIKFYTHGVEGSFNIHIDASGYTDTAGMKEIERYVVEKLKIKFGEDRVNGTSTAIADAAITSGSTDSSGSEDGEFMVTILKKY